MPNNGEEIFQVVPLRRALSQLKAGNGSNLVRYPGATRCFTLSMSRSFDFYRAIRWAMRDS